MRILIPKEGAFAWGFLCRFPDFSRLVYYSSFGVPAKAGYVTGEFERDSFEAMQ